jgi:hypothetical protein
MSSFLSTISQYSLLSVMLVKIDGPEEGLFCQDNYKNADKKTIS